MTPEFFLSEQSVWWLGKSDSGVIYILDRNDSSISPSCEMFLSCYTGVCFLVCSNINGRFYINLSVYTLTFFFFLPVCLVVYKVISCICFHIRGSVYFLLGKKNYPFESNPHFLYPSFSSFGNLYFFSCFLSRPNIYSTPFCSIFLVLVAVYLSKLISLSA